MITNQHNDGCCFKLTVTSSDPNTMEERIYIMYGEDEDELWYHYIETRHVLGIIRKIKIEDDSK